MGGRGEAHSGTAGIKYSGVVNPIISDRDGGLVQVEDSAVLGDVVSGARGKDEIKLLP